METDKPMSTNEPTPPSKTVSKAAFIRSLPLDIPTKEVVQRAKEAGIMVAEDYVQDVRSAMKKAPGGAKPKAAPKKTSKPKPAPKAAKPKVKAAPKKAAKGDESLTKAGFVRSQPLTMAAKEIVAAGAKLGMALTPDYIHKVRSATKAKAKDKPVVVKKAPAPRAKTPAAPKARPAKLAPKAEGVRVTPTETTFRKMVLELGLGHAKGLLADVERKLGALIAGK